MRPLRKEGYLLIGSGGAVHNLYRNHWTQMIRYRDNFAMPSPPGSWALEFRQAFEDAVTKNSGPELKRAVAQLMKHPDFRDAHGTDEHYIPALFVAGAVGDMQDRGCYGKLCAEDWELVSCIDRDTSRCSEDYVANVTVGQHVQQSIHVWGMGTLGRHHAKWLTFCAVGCTSSCTLARAEYTTYSVSWYNKTS